MTKMRRVIPAKKLIRKEYVGTERSNPGRGDFPQHQTHMNSKLETLRENLGRTRPLRGAIRPQGEKKSEKGTGTRAERGQKVRLESGLAEGRKKKTGPFLWGGKPRKSE